MDISAEIQAILADFLYALFLYLYNIILPLISGFELPSLPF